MIETEETRMPHSVECGLWPYNEVKDRSCEETGRKDIKRSPGYLERAYLKSVRTGFPVLFHPEDHMPYPDP